MEARPKPRAKTRVFSTLELHPLPDPLAIISTALDEAEEEETQERVSEELDRIFGPDSSEGAEFISGLVLWIKNTEQAATVSGSLAAPHEEEAKRHRRRQQALERRAGWLRERLVLLLSGRGGRFSDGLHKIHTRATAKVSILGTCTKHEDVHYETDRCGTFTPDDSVPLQFVRIKYEPKKDDIQAHLIELEKAEKGVPWAQLARRLVAVIR